MEEIAAVLWAEIREELDALELIQAERNAIQARIDVLLEQIEKVATAQGDADLMNEESRILFKIANINDTSAEATGEVNELLQSATALDRGADSSPQQIAALERALDKAKYSKALSITLRDSLRDLLEELKEIAGRQP
jgi:DNA repair ATPase RecN